MSSPRTGRLGYSHIKKESVWGTYLTPDLQFRIISESLNRAVEHTEDPALVGEIYTTEMIKTADGANGTMEATAHGNEMGPLYHGVLGGESAVSDPSEAFIVISYNGSANYARLTMTSGSLLAEDSPDGSSWSPDTNFNTTGTIDTSTAPFDTALELATAIAGYTGYDAKIFGKSASASTNIADFAATQLKADSQKVGAFVIKYQVSASTTAKTHTLFPADADTLLPSYTVQVNRTLGTDKSVAFTGCKFSSISTSVSAKDLAKLSASLTSKGEIEDQTDIASSPPNVQAMTASNTQILVIDSGGNQVDMEEVKDLSYVINSNIDENRVIGDLEIKEQIRQNATIEINYTANNISTQYALRSDYTADNAVETFIYMESNTNADTDNSIPFSILVRLPRIKYSDFNSPLSTPDRLVITAAGKTEKPQNDVYTNHIEILVTDDELTAY
jgi:hypothetical protein